MLTMSKSKIFVTRDHPGSALTELQNLYEVTINLEDHPVSKRVLMEQVDGVSGVIACVGDRINDEVMDASGGTLQAICNAIVGFDNVDLAAATKRGIYVTNTPGVLTETVADLTFGLILSAARNITFADRYIRTGKWHGWGPKQFLGIDVYGKTLGIIGLGRIGYAVAKRAQGFNMKLLFYDVVRNPELESKYGLIFASLDTLLQQSDYVSIHVPLIPQTRHFISERELNLMKSTAILINTSRGPVINEKALINALQTEKIRGAGIDVWDPEPPQGNNPLLSMDNVVALPHIASASIETRSLMIQMAIDNLKCILQGKMPPNLVNQEVINVRSLSSN